jgi:predicted transcriptional regulator
MEDFVQPSMENWQLCSYQIWNSSQKNRRYFLEHDVRNIPYEFYNRLGELLDSTLEIDAVRVLDQVTTMLKEAGEYIWAQSYHISPNHIPILEKKVQEDVDFRGIYPTDFKLTSTLVNYLRFLEKINLRILVTEKEAMVGFLHLSGQPDYSAFFSIDSKFIKWCKDIHKYYWQTAHAL